MKFRVGACALLVCLAGCSSEGTNGKFGDLVGSASPGAAGAKQVPDVRTARNPADSIASAPDHGALVSYRNNGVASKQEGAYTWYPIAVSEEHALRAVATGEMTIPSPDGSQVKLRYERHVEHADGNWTWIGRVEGGDQNQEAILTFGEQAVYGSVPQAAGAPALSLQTRGGALWAVVTDPSKVVSPNKGTNDVMVPPALALRASLASAASKSQVTQKAVAAGAPATAANTIDVAIGYTQGFATAQGGQSAAVTRLNFLVEVGNQAFTNSLINGYLRIVNTVQVNYADNTANEAALGQLTGHNGSSSVTVPAALVPIRTARDQYGADLAVLVRKFETPENDGCGIAWLNGANQAAINPTADDDFGFAVISDGNDTGTDGKSYFCSPETLVHELAHLMGSAHDRDNSRNDQGGLQYGRYPYSFGMKTDTANGNFYTIMAYGDDNQNFYRTFSSPLVARCGPTGNLVCGVVDQTDNARSLNQTIPVVAGFRASVLPFEISINDINNDKKSDLFWQNGNLIAYWLMNGGATLSTGYVGGPVGSFQVIASGDFNGDQYVDLAWSNGNQLIFWLNNQSGGYTGSPGIFYGDSWQPFAAADIDGDGKSDLLWRNGSQVAHWLMNGTVLKSSGYTGNAGAGFKLAAVGDFNGDGVADLAFANGSAAKVWTNSGTGTFTSGANIAYGGGWSPVAAIDMNGDGRSDLIWRSSSAIAYWLMNGGVVQSSGYLVDAGTGFKLVAAGDYNGDGKGDMAFATGNQMKIWINAPGSGVTGSFGAVMAYGSGWQPFDPTFPAP
jgi:hypothetical protein